MRIRKGNKNYNVLIFDMKRLFKSSNFWNAVFAALVMFLTVQFVDDKDIQKDLALYEFILFGGRVAVSGLADILKANKGVTYNESTGKEEIIK